MQNTFIPELRSIERPKTPSIGFIFSNGKILLAPENPENPLPDISINPFNQTNLQRLLSIGFWNNNPCVAAELPDDAEIPAPFQWLPLRQSFAVLGEIAFSIAGRAHHMQHWDRTHRFCGSCGAPFPAELTTNVKICSRCDASHFPTLSPAVIVAVTRGNEILLARSARFRNAKMFSVLAGFVEPGETLESAVAREVYEETRISVENIRYFGSQPWPFPNALMIGFTATYASGEIDLADDELVEAGWFSAKNMPHLSQPPSIARKLIDHFLAENGVV